MPNPKLPAAWTLDHSVKKTQIGDISDLKVDAGKATRFTSMKSILIVRTGEIGDTIVSFPAIKGLKELYPNHSLIVLTDKHKGAPSIAWELAIPSRWLDAIISYDASLKGIRRVFEWLKLIFRIRRLQSEAVYYFSQNRRSALGIKIHYLFFKYLCGIKKEYGFSFVRHPSRNHKMATVIPEYERLFKIAHSGVQSNGSLSACSSFSRIDIPTSEKVKANDTISNLKLEKSHIIAFGPGSKMQAKRWPIERFSEVGKRLLELYSNIAFVVFGGPQDEATGEFLVEEWRGSAVNFCGKLSLLGTASLLEKSFCYVGNDSGIMHLAGALRVPCIALFSARDYPGLWEPLGKGHTLLRKEVECAGCMLETCIERNKECLTKIGVEEVVKAVINTLKCSSIGRAATGAKN